MKGKSLLKAIDRANAGVNRGINNVASKAVSGTAKGLSRTMTKDVKPTFFNAFTGKAPSKIGTAVVGGGIIGAYGVKTSIDNRFEDKTGETSYSGNAPVFNADGASNSAPRLGATGDIVLGANKMRRRG